MAKTSVIRLESQVTVQEALATGTNPAQGVGSDAFRASFAALEAQLSDGATREEELSQRLKQFEDQLSSGRTTLATLTVTEATLRVSSSTIMI